MKCICSKEWLSSYDIRGNYVSSRLLPHSEICDSKFRVDIRELRDEQIIARWKWMFATNESCNSRYSHGPHGSCTGLAFDRT